MLIPTGLTETLSVMLNSLNQWNACKLSCGGGVHPAVPFGYYISFLHSFHMIVREAGSVWCQKVGRMSRKGDMGVI